MDAEHPRVEAIWAALQGEGEVALGPGVAESPRCQGPGVSYRERELATALRKSPAPPSIVVVDVIGPTLLRALREAPPALLVWLGEYEDSGETMRDLGTRMWVLGPGASFHHRGTALASSSRILVAHSRAELEGLRRTLRAADDEAVVLCLSPTPSWLCHLLSAPRLLGTEVLGTIHASSLTPDWVRWAQSHEAHVIVPVGVEDADLDRPAFLGPLVAAQALERWTGPVFPSPRVIAAIAAGLERLRGAETRPAAPVDTAAMAVWVQARRALPWLGDMPGMQQPDPADPLEAPTSSFLAQAALLRARVRMAARDDPPPAPPVFEDEGLHRALEVLRAAGERLSDQESKVVLRAFGLEVTRQAVANSASGASGFAERIGFPVVLKALSPDLRRRSDVGGILLNLETAAAVRRGYATIVDNIERRAPTLHLDGVLVAEMVPEGLDLRCGSRRLPTGEIALYGAVELPVGLCPEVSLALVPLTPSRALEMAQAILQNAWVPTRRHDDPDARALAQLLLTLSMLLERTEDRVMALDLGPLRWVGASRGYVTLDASIVQRPHLQGL